MVNTELLREKIDSSGVKITFLAKEIGITYMALTNKMNKKVDFKCEEAGAIKKVLRLTDEEVKEIFFA